MPSQKQEDHHLRAHPLLSRSPARSAPTSRLSEAMSGLKSGKYVRLYPSLGDLGFWLGIDKSDIVASAPAPETLLPHGEGVVWVRPHAHVVCRGDRVIAVGARGPLGAEAYDETTAGATEISRLVEVKKGPL